MLVRVEFLGFVHRLRFFLVGFEATLVSGALRALAVPPDGATGVDSRRVLCLQEMCSSGFFGAYADSAAIACVDLCVCVCK